MFVGNQLAQVNVSGYSTPECVMDMPGLRLHELKGSRAGIRSVTVSGNWRITFRFAERNAKDVNYEDYH